MALVAHDQVLYRVALVADLDVHRFEATLLVRDDERVQAGLRLKRNADQRLPLAVFAIDEYRLVAKSCLRACRRFGAERDAHDSARYRLRRQRGSEPGSKVARNATARWRSLVGKSMSMGRGLSVDAVMIWCREGQANRAARQAGSIFGELRHETGDRLVCPRRT